MDALALTRMVISRGPFNTLRFAYDVQTLIRVYFLYSAVDLGLIEALKTPLSKEALITQLGVKRPDILEALLDVGISLKELSKKNGLYALSGKRAKCLARDKEESFIGMVQAYTTFYHLAFEGAAKRAKGGPLTDLIETYAEIVARFSTMTEPFIFNFIKGIVKGNQALRILEIGCGSGIHIRSAYNVNPHVHGIGLDMDAKVVNQATEIMQAWGLSERFRIVCGDILNPTEEIKASYDIVTLFNNIYYFQKEKRPALFNTLREMLTARGRIALATFTANEGNDPFGAALNLATCSDIGCTALPDLEELKTLMETSGFINITTKTLLPRTSFIGLLAEVP